MCLNVPSVSPYPTSFTVSCLCQCAGFGRHRFWDNTILYNTCTPIWSAVFFFRTRSLAAQTSSLSDILIISMLLFNTLRRLRLKSFIVCKGHVVRLYNFVKLDYLVQCLKAVLIISIAYMEMVPGRVIYVYCF
jgi:hypothetical protein